MRQPAMLAAAVSAAIATNTHAITLTQADLPTALTGCASATCIVDLNSTVDTSFMSAFLMAQMRPDGSGYDFSWLLRYALTSTSALTYIADPSYGTSSTIPYTGYLWLQAPRTLDLSGQNQFNIYTDQIQPDPDAYNFEDDLSTWVFGMNAQSAIAGSAAYYNSGANDYTDPVEYGDLVMQDGPLICIECGIDVRLNLVGLDYAANGTSTFDPSDSRGLLLSHRSFYESWSSTTHAFYVQAVPLPAAAWMFASGLIAVGALARKRVPAALDDMIE